jgi:hypothetical protein
MTMAPHLPRQQPGGGISYIDSAPPAARHADVREQTRSYGGGKGERTYHIIGPLTPEDAMRRLHEAVDPHWQGMVPVRADIIIQWLSRWVCRGVVPYVACCRDNADNAKFCRHCGKLRPLSPAWSKPKRLPYG